MRKFSHQVSINENIGNTFNLGKSVDKFPECFDDILDLVQLYSESYSESVSNSTVTIGFIDPTSLSKMTKVQGLSIISHKKIKGVFPDGNIPDRWSVCVRLVIKFKPIESDWVSSQKGDWVKSSTQIWGLKQLDEISFRVNSIKGLISRLERWCDCYFSLVNSEGFSGSDTGESACLLAVLKNDLWK